MRAKSSILITALCFSMIISASAQELNVQLAAYKPGNFLTNRNASDNLKGTGTATLESSVHREGLQFYFEIRNGGLAELARAAKTFGPVSKLLASGPMKVSTTDMMG